MSKKHLEHPRRRIGVYVGEDLLSRFDTHYEGRYGEFTKIINDLLKHHLNELDEKQLRFRKESSQWNKQRLHNG